MSLFDTYKQFPGGEYPENWKEISGAVKDEVGWRCERCQHVHDPASGYTLTVHHLVYDKNLCERWNLAALCQECHLKVQGRANMFQTFMFESIPPFDWFKPHLDGFLEWCERRKQNEST